MWGNLWLVLNHFEEMHMATSELTAIAIKNLKEPGRHAVGGVRGLLLVVKPSGSKNWSLRTTIGGKRCDIGLGGYPTVTLAMAKDSARIKLEEIKQGINPIVERKKARAALANKTQASRTFASQAEKFIAMKSAEWSSSKQEQIWTNSLKTYAMPVIGKMDIGEITTNHILEILNLDFWLKKTETAKRVQGRIETILDWAQVAKPYRIGENPARWKHHLENLLPSPSKFQKVIPHKALPFTRLNEFMNKLRACELLYKQAVEFCILTCVRSNDVRGATWGEVNIKTKVWEIPEARLKIKNKGSHQVPLSEQAFAILQTRLDVLKGAANPNGYIFTSTKDDKINDSALNNIVVKLGYEAVADLHGFRSTFKDWASESMDFSDELTEQVLAHVVPSDKRPYRRGVMFKKRVKVMQEWADFAEIEQSALDSDIDFKPE